MRKSIMCTGFLCLALTGCMRSQTEAQWQSTPAEAGAFTYPASIRGAYVRPAETKQFICAEPFPDAATDESNKLATKLAAEIAKQLSVTGVSESSLTGTASAESSLDRSLKIVELSGRSELVLVMREALYRVCEASYNDNGFDKAERLDLYKTALKSVADIAEAIKNEGEAKKAEAEAKKAEAEAKKKIEEVKAQAKSGLGGAESVLAVKLAEEAAKAFNECEVKAGGAAADAQEEKKGKCKQQLEERLKTIRKIVEGKDE